MKHLLGLLLLTLSFNAHALFTASKYLEAYEMGEHTRVAIQLYYHGIVAAVGFSHPACNKLLNSDEIVSILEQETARQLKTIKQAPSSMLVVEVGATAMINECNRLVKKYKTD